MTRVRVGSATDTGLVRHINQDQLLVSDELFAVADGMGGHAGGEVASLTAVEALRAAFAPDNGTAKTPEALRDAVRAANEAVFDRAQSGDELRGMGTTMTAAALVVNEDEQRLAIANVGDSRAYVFSQGELTQLTEDHSVPEELVRRGELDPDEVATHPQRHMLTRVLGVFSDVDVDLWEVIPFSGDRILLCSDGLCRELTDDQIAAVLRRLADPVEAVKELIRLARANGGADNITAILLDVIDDDGRAKAASAALAGEPGATSAARATAADHADSGPAAEAERPSGPTGRGPETVTAALPGRRRVTLRAASFVVLLVLIGGSVGYAIHFYGRETFYVGLAPGKSPPSPGDPVGIVIYRGRPGGLLWFHSTVEQRTGLTTADILPFRVADLRAGKIEPSLARAHAYLANLTQEASSLRAGPSSTSTLPPLPPAPVGATTVR